MLPSMKPTSPHSPRSSLSRSLGDGELVRAGAGAGKTQMLCERLIEQVYTCGVAPEKCVAVTFTRASARELRDRTRALVEARAGLDSSAMEAVHIGTMDAVLPRLIGVDGKLMYGARLDVLKQQAFDRLMMTAATDVASLLGLLDPKLGRHALYKAIVGHAELLRVRRARSPWHLVNASDLAQAYAALLRRYESQYAALKAASGVMDQYDVLDAALKSSASLGFVCLDEAQDVDPLQLAAWQHLTRTGTLLAVGDIAQSIYAFRNADPEHVFAALPHGRDLSTNYRCASSIISLANELKSTITGLLVQKAARAEHGTIDAVIVQSSEECATNDAALCTAQLIVDERRSATTPRTIAVICRTNRECKLVVERLHAVGLAAEWNPAASMHESDAVTALVTYATALAGLEPDRAATAELLQQFAGVSPEVARKCTADATFEQAMDAAGALNPKFLSRHRDLSAMTHAVPLHLRLRAIVAEHDYLSTTPSSSTEARRSPLDATEVDCIRALLDGVRTEEDLTLDELQTFLTRYRWHGAVEQRRPRPDAVAVLTVHQVKGLEYDSVYIPFVRTLAERHSGAGPAPILVGVAPSGNVDIGIAADVSSCVQHARLRRDAEGAATAEARRLLYVAITRARDRLTLMSWDAAGKWPRELTFLYRALQRVARAHNGVVTMQRTTRNATPMPQRAHTASVAVTPGIPVRRTPMPPAITYTSLTARDRSRAASGTSRPISRGRARRRGEAVHRCVTSALLVRDATAGAGRECDAFIKQCLSRAAMSDVYAQLCSAAICHVEDDFEFFGPYRGRIDAWVDLGYGSALIVDWKTGHENIERHRLQRMMYALALLPHFDEVRVVTVNLGPELWPQREDTWNRGDGAALKRCLYDAVRELNAGTN
jgi:superfamily I DNA/RNA helicase